MTTAVSTGTPAGTDLAGLPAGLDAARAAGLELCRQVAASLDAKAPSVEALVHAGIGRLSRMGIRAEVVRARPNCVVVRSATTRAQSEEQACAFLTAWLEALPAVVHDVGGTVVESACRTRGSDRCVHTLLWQEPAPARAEQPGGEASAPAHAGEPRPAAGPGAIPEGRTDDSPGTSTEGSPARPDTGENASRSWVDTAASAFRSAPAASAPPARPGTPVSQDAFVLPGAPEGSASSRRPATRDGQTAHRGRTRHLRPSPAAVAAPTPPPAPAAAPTPSAIPAAGATPSPAPVAAPTPPLAPAAAPTPPAAPAAAPTPSAIPAAGATPTPAPVAAPTPPPAPAAAPTPPAATRTDAPGAASRSALRPAPAADTWVGGAPGAPMRPANSGRRWAWLRRRAWLLALGLVAGAAGGYYASSHQVTSYSATAVLVVRSGASPTGPGSANDAEALAVTDAAVMPNDQTVVGQVATELGVTSSVVSRSLSVQAEAGTALMQVRYSAPTAAQAVAGANTVARVVSGVRVNDQAIANGSIAVVSRAKTASPSGSLTRKGLPLGAVLGLLLGAGAAMAAERTDRRVDEGQTLEDATGSPVTVVPGGVSPAEMSRALDRSVDGRRYTLVPLRGAQAQAAAQLARELAKARTAGGGSAPAAVTVPFADRPDAVCGAEGPTVLVVGTGERVRTVHEVVERLRRVDRRPVWSVLVASR